MLYFAYGSNLNHNQMKRIRCIGSKYLKSFSLKNYDLSFCHYNKDNVFGYANVYKKKRSKVPGAIWKITKRHEIILDKYEEFPKAYIKDYFYLNREKVMFYIMSSFSFKKPSKRYLDLVKKGYADCNLEPKYLKKKLSDFNIK